MTPASPCYSFLQRSAFEAAFLWCSTLQLGYMVLQCTNVIVQAPVESWGLCCQVCSRYLDKTSNLSVPSTQIKIAEGTWFLFPLLLQGMLGWPQRYPQSCCNGTGRWWNLTLAPALHLLTHHHRHNCGVTAWDRRTSGRGSCRIFEGTGMLMLVMCSVAVVTRVMNVSKIWWFLGVPPNCSLQNLLGNIFFTAAFKTVTVQWWHPEGVSQALPLLEEL